MEEGTRWFKEQDPEKITLTSYDGLKLSAYLLPAEKKSRNVLLLMHGYRCDGFSDFPACISFIMIRDIICWCPTREAMRKAMENISVLV